MAEVARLRLDDTNVRLHAINRVQTKSVLVDEEVAKMETELTAVREQIVVTRRTQFALLGNHESLADLEAKISGMNSHARAIEFVIQVLKDEKVKLSASSGEGGENVKRLETSLADLKNQEQQIAGAVVREEAEIQDLERKAKALHPTAATLDSLQAKNKDLLHRIDTMMLQLDQGKEDGVGDSVLTKEGQGCKDRMEALLFELETLYAAQNRACESTMDMVALILEREEKRLEAMTKRRELDEYGRSLEDRGRLDAIPEDGTVAALDYESRDIDDRQEILSGLHMKMKVANERREALVRRISELKREILDFSAKYMF